jgi:reductive dehalogenase
VKKAASIFLPLKYPISAAQYNVVQHFSSIREEEVTATRAPIPEDPQVLSRHIKRLGYFLKADIVGICRLPKSAVYTHERDGKPVNINYRNAIVLVVSKEYETVDASSGFDWIGDSLSFQAYLRLAVIAEVIASYIKKLGYPALPQSVAGGYQVLIPPLLLWAGIGEVSRAGIILSPFLGLGFKAAAVLTDMPLVPDMPVDFGLQDFCQHCQACAEICPSNAILSGDKVLYNGYETWKLNEQRCASYSVSNKNGTICNLCVKVCPWTRLLTWKQNLFRWAVGRSSFTRKLALRSIKRPIRSGPRQDKKWWFDLQ